MVPNIRTEILEFLGDMEQLVTLVWAFWVVNYENYAVNHVLVCMRPKMAVKPGFAM